MWKITFTWRRWRPSIHRDSWTSRESRVVGNTQKLLAIFEQFDVRGTFFVLGWVAERYPQLVKDIAAGGHEIACHGFSHRLVYEQSPHEFREEALRSKNLLEDITGSAVLGYRAASYSIVRESLWALDILVELGFVYDSSIFPVRHDRYGIPDAERIPHRLTTPNRKNHRGVAAVHGTGAWFQASCGRGRILQTVAVLGNTLGAVVD